MSNTEFILARHAHSVFNGNYTYNCDPAKDRGLDAQGREQARLLAQRLEKEKITVVYSSPFPRAIETAKRVAEPHKLAVEIDERLWEHRTGHWEGLTKAEVLTRFPEEKAAERADRLNYLIPGKSENYGQIKKRIKEFLEEKAAGNQDEKVLVVTHDAVIRSALAAVLEDDCWLDKKPGYAENASITIIQKVNGKWKLKVFNDTRHLKMEND